MSDTRARAGWTRENRIGNRIDDRVDDRAVRRA
jgi:hypothetical protein